MQKTVEHARGNNRVSPAIELLVRERSKGKSLRQLGQMFNRSHEKVRHLLAKHGMSQVTLLTERRVAAKLGYPAWWLAQLRKEGIISPIKPGSYWLYSEEQVRQISSLIAQIRRCERCGKPRPLGSQRFCRECNQYRRNKLRKSYYKRLSPEAKVKHKERCRAWQKANPERWKEIGARAGRRYRAKRLERTQG